MTIPVTAPLTLADILDAAGVSLDDVLLIRHPLSHARVRDALATGTLIDYTSDQDASFPSRHPYWLIFLGEEATSARFVTCYRNAGRPSGGFFDLDEVPVLADLSGRLVIDWGPGTRSWKQNGTSVRTKPVLAIAERAVEPFPGYEEILLSFAELERILIEPRRYSAWQTALSSVNAVYLIVDTLTGRQYVGSAYGDGGLLQRWKAYVDTYHGGNKLLVAELQADPETYARFQFSILQILPKTATPDAVVAVESVFKNKLLTRQFGLNAN